MMYGLRCADNWLYIGVIAGSCFAARVPIATAQRPRTNRSGALALAFVESSRRGTSAGARAPAESLDEGEEGNARRW